MIDVVISNSCKHCHTQLEVMQKSFFEDEYRIINADSSDFEGYKHRDKVVGFPFIVVRDDNGKVKYADVGVHDGTELHKIERRQPVKPFNLSQVAQAK